MPSFLTKLPVLLLLFLQDRRGIQSQLVVKVEKCHKLALANSSYVLSFAVYQLSSIDRSD
jgi:hypothetical protein